MNSAGPFIKDDFSCEKNPPLRILQVIGGMNRGGAETLIMNLYRNIDRTKIQFDFVVYYDFEGHYDQEIISLGGRLIHLPQPKTGPVNAVRHLCAAIKSFGPYHGLHAHNLHNAGFAMLAAYICGISHRITHSHTTAENYKPSLTRMVYAFAMRILIALLSTDYLACSHAAGCYLYGSRITKNNKYRYFPNAINLKPFIDYEPNNTIRKELKIPIDSFVIGHVGRFETVKNHPFLLQILEEVLLTIPDAVLLLIGDGKERQKIIVMAEKMGLSERVFMIGIRSDIPDCLRAMNAFVFPSFYEGVGIALLEAQAAGLPCIGSTAIQPEADVGLGLVKRISLDQPVKTWCLALHAVMYLAKPESAAILKAFEDSGMLIEDAVAKLLKVYQCKNQSCK